MPVFSTSAITAPFISEKFALECMEAKESDCESIGVATGPTS